MQSSPMIVYDRQNHYFLHFQIAGHAFHFTADVRRAADNVARPFTGIPRERVGPGADTLEFVDSFLRCWHGASLAPKPDAANQHFRARR